ncbi:MAG: aspartate/glutamate racemase family protein [Candidatus Thorarchaeota archaeon]|nr:aspartate/glutamate racemase family protein [Candidatus Thorarchaeota archaeon]
MRKIALIGVTGKDWWTDPDKREFVKKHTPEGYEMINYYARYGTHSVESNADEAYNAPFILEQIVKAEKDGVDAIIIDCACDPILDAAREVTTKPVIGVRQAALHLALSLGSKFSIITVQGQSLVRCMESGIRKEGLESFCASVRYFKMPVLELEGSPEKAQKELQEMAKQVIDDGADVIVLGCTGLSHKIDLSEITRVTGVPIIDPFVVGIWTAVTLIESGLSHSKLAYPNPPKKPITEIPSLEGSLDDIVKE